MSTGLVWFRNDLRVHDNEALALAARHDRLVCAYAADERQWGRLEEPGIRRTGPHRTAFLLQSLQDLRDSLEALGNGLLVTSTTAPAAALKKWVDELGVEKVYVQAEVADEEMKEEELLAQALGDDDRLVRVYGKALHHPQDVPFGFRETPEPFRNFRRAVEKLTVREPLDDLTELPPPPAGFAPGDLLSLTDFGYEKGDADPAFPGGETAGLKRLAYYVEEADLLPKYRSTRNLSLGADYSTKFSAYLALGCLSPRTVYARIRDRQAEVGKKVGNNVIFEMRWRDYFLYLARKHGNRVFRPGGFKDRKHEWVQDQDLFRRWRQGKTGLPFVDAHMRELDQTGFMSNRGRVNCSSFLTRDYKLDWRWGAAWFENRLIDYDVAANWFNWHTQALEIYYTSAPWQGLKYDKKGAYVKHWLPELSELPAPLVHAPWKMDEEGMLDALDFELERDYYRPGVENSKWDWAWGRLKTGDASSPRRKKG